MSDSDCDCDCDCDNVTDEPLTRFATQRDRLMTAAIVKTETFLELEMSSHLWQFWYGKSFAAIDFAGFAPRAR